jgi:hypothetical protein
MIARINGLFAVLSLLVTVGAARAQEAKPSVVAVFLIENRGSPLTDQELVSLTDYLGTKLGETGKYRIIPRDEIRARLTAEKKKSFKECVDQSCQIEIGRELAAQLTVNSSISRVGSKCIITAAMFDLQKAATSRTASAKGKCLADDLVVAVEQIAAKLLGQPTVVEKAPPVEKPAPAPLPPPTPVVKEKKTKSMLAAGLLSILPGGGMYYVGKWGWGLLYTCLVIGGIGAGLSSDTVAEDPDMVYAYIGVAAAAWIGGAIHAIIAARDYEEEVEETASLRGGFYPVATGGRGSDPHPAVVIPVWFGRF